MERPELVVDLSDAIERYVRGEGAQKICASIPGLSERRLLRELRTRGIMRSREERYRLIGDQVRRPRLTIPTEEIVSRYIAGESELSLSKAFGVSRPTISGVLRRAGVARRGFAQNALVASSRTPEQNAAIIAAAHSAARGRVISNDELVRRAKTREQRRSNVSHHELFIERQLRLRELVGTPQKACGKYNIDLAVGPIAVEIYGGGWHSHGRHIARAPQRFRYLFDEGWCCLVIWVTANKSGYLLPGAVEYLVAWLDEIERDPSSGSGYRVIWGSGEEIARGGPDGDELARIRPRRRRVDPT